MQIKHDSETDQFASMAPWPIVASHRARLQHTDLLKISDLCACLRKEHPELRSNWFAELGVQTGWQNAPCLYIEDHRSITRMSEKGSQNFEYRMLGLSGPGDGFLVSAPRVPEFEAYMSRMLGTESPRVWAAAPKRHKRRRLTDDARSNKSLLADLVRLAERGRGLNIVPYIASGDVWILASAIAKASAQPVSVLGPPPALSTLANDKLWFSQTVSRLIGSNSIPLTREIHSMTQLVRAIQDLVSHSSRLVLKLPSSAGGLGNLNLNAAPFRGLRPRDMLTKVRRQLSEIGWRAGDKLLVGVWDTNVRISPSVQIWIPEPSGGDVIIEGLFTQQVEGEEGAFIGAERAELQPDLVDALIYQAKQIATLFQSLGYVGRLSLDAVILSDRDSPENIHWIEANARWGGVSIPLTLANKLNRWQPSYQLVITQFLSNEKIHRSIESIETRLRAQKSEAGFSTSEIAIFLVPPRTGLILVISLARTTQRARDLAEMALNACLSH